jgi:hypothetical protein
MVTLETRPVKGLLGLVALPGAGDTRAAGSDRQRLLGCHWTWPPKENSARCWTRYPERTPVITRLMRMEAGA